MNDELGTILPLDNWLIVFFSTFQLIEWLESFSLEKENIVTYYSKRQLASKHLQGNLGNCGTYIIIIDH